MRKTISVVIPVHNEERNIPLVYEGVVSALNTVPAYAHEIIFVNDGSKDSSLSAINDLRHKDKHVRCVEFTRNFGKEAATTAGIRAATGDAIIMLDADLQHPPEIIPEFVKRWEEGAEVVTGVRSSNRGEGLVKRYGSKLFYFIMSKISDADFTPGETDFRLLDKQVSEAFSLLQERGRMTRSLVNWLGFKKDVVYFDAAARLHGAATYSKAKLFNLAVHSFAANSLLPLRLAGYLGLLMTSFSFLLGIVVLIERYVMHDPWGWNVTGSAQLAIINAFLIGVVLMALGIIALYIGRISDEVSRRPLYVVRKERE